MDSIPQTYRCGKCKQRKPFTDFDKGRNTGGIQSYCKACKRTGPRTHWPKTGPRRDLTGDRHTTWSVIEWVPDEQRWLCRCDCGKERLLQGYQWRARIGNRTCDCQGNTRVHTLPPGEAACNALMTGYIAGAVKRRLPFELTREQFRMLTSMDCAYCGRAPSQSQKVGQGMPYIYTGIDRVDPTKGYVWDNCLPACRYCNQAKSAMTLDEWKAHIRQIYAYMRLGE